MLVSSACRASHFDTATVWGCTALALALLPLWVFKYTPATDLPQHVALSAVAFRLQQGDPIIQAVYGFNIQPISYHMVYPFYALAQGVLHESTMFGHSHMTVQVRHKPVRAMDRRVGVGTFDHEGAASPVEMAPYDHALVQGSPALRKATPIPQDRELIYAAGWWHLYRRLPPRTAAAAAQPQMVQ